MKTVNQDMESSGELEKLEDRRSWRRRCESGHLEPGPRWSKDRILCFWAKEDHSIRRKTTVGCGLESGEILLMKQDTVYIYRTQSREGRWTTRDVGA